MRKITHLWGPVQKASGIYPNHRLWPSLGFVFFTIHMKANQNILDIYDLLWYTVIMRKNKYTLLSPQDQLRYFPASVVACKAIEHPLGRFDEEQEMRQR